MKMTAAFFSLVLFIFLGAPGAFAYSDNPTPKLGYLGGQVLDGSDNHVLPGVEVQVVPYGSVQPLEDVKTDANGDWLVKIPVGNYVVNFIRSGYVEFTYNSMNVVEGEPHQSLTWLATANGEFKTIKPVRVNK